MELAHSIEKIKPGVYLFDVAFFAGASTVRDAQGVRGAVAANLGIPEEHNFQVGGGDRQRRGLTFYPARATFMEFDDTGNPEIRIADVGIEVHEPGLVARGFAKLLGRDPTATLTARAEGLRPYDGGPPAASPAPDNPPPLPVPPTPGMLAGML